MGNIVCDPQDAALVSAAARSFCPFPDYSPSPLLNLLSANSSELLSEHYAKVQASLTPQQQQDFTRSLRDTFGREGKVSYGGVGIVALSLAVLFDTVARQVKGEIVSDHEPIPGLFLKDPRGTYPPPVYTASQYLRLVPYIANNPTRMRNETHKFQHKLNLQGPEALDSIYTTQRFEDITGLDLMKCAFLVKTMVFYLNHAANTTIDLEKYGPKKRYGGDPQPFFNLNCDPEKAGERFLNELDSFDDRTKEAFKKCSLNRNKKKVLKDVAELEFMMEFMMAFMKTAKEDEGMHALRVDFDLKAKALGRWM